MRPTFDVAKAHTNTGVLSKGNPDAACILVCSVRVTPILKKRKTAFNDVQVEFDQFLSDHSGVCKLATVNPDGLPGNNLEAHSRSMVALGRGAKHANSPIARDVVIT